jgi:hypothetical protein
MQYAAGKLYVLCVCTTDTGLELNNTFSQKTMICKAVRVTARLHAGRTVQLGFIPLTFQYLHNR